MFKKADDVRERSGKSAMRKKDVQNLKAALLLQMPRLSETQEALSALLSGGEVTQSKLVTKTIVYYVDNAPMVFDEQGRNRLFPTVLFLFLFPSCLRTYVIHGPVSRFVLKGADLMLPGLATLEGLDGILVDERVSIRIVGNPLPFAVAQSTSTWSSILESPRKGRACEVVHLFGDFLVPVSPQSIVRANVGFEKKGVVTSLPSFTDTVTSVFGDEDVDEGSDGGREDGDGDGDGDDEEFEEGGGDELSAEDTQDLATDKDKTASTLSDSALPAASPAALGAR
jgi:predicted ribosome-associated RNA-binding protein Tma20